ncbi:hypothetical protein [Roseivirga sp. UBA838]|uniref:hypothetical protein n=1 Tax=Roseivirga sp. UBA838 TaxID=1947393 RepID=UPI00257D0785|nr:hypothetical protein [Roseivirga sp. UBA838]|tara:strand:- start:100176 stop:100457 length:282 start_codon:yes stop_codon:yes gene_type:complete
MFESKEYPASLDESQFELWLEQGRESKLSYEYMLIVWDDLEATYHPEYVESRDLINKHPFWGQDYGSSVTIAVYDLYSEARISISDWQTSKGF